MLEAAISELFEDELAQPESLCVLLIERLLTVTEQERSRLAEILHDDALQLGYQTERLLRDTLECGFVLPPQAAGFVSEALHLTRALLARLRETMCEYYPAPLSVVGLPVALQTLLQGVEQRAGLICSLEGASGSLSPEQETILYTIAREAIFNVVRHAHATTLRVTLCREDRDLLLQIRDNGIGFALPSAGERFSQGHLGLALLQERTRRLRGILRIETTPQQGTTLIVRVPLDTHVSTPVERNGSNSSIR